MTDPPPVEHRRLVDDVGALLHQVVGRRGAVFVRVIPVVVAADDLAPARLEQIDVALLVMVAAALQEDDLWILALARLVDQSRVRLSLEIGEVTASQKPNQVRRRKDQLAVWSPSPMHATDSNGTAIGGTSRQRADNHREEVRREGSDCQPGEQARNPCAKVAESVGNAGINMEGGAGFAHGWHWPVFTSLSKTPMPRCMP